MKVVWDNYLKKDWDKMKLVVGTTKMGMSAIAIKDANYMLKGLGMKQIKGVTNEEKNNNQKKE